MNLGSIFILYIATHVNSGTVVTTQEFSSLNQCSYVATFVRKHTQNLEYAHCFLK